MKTKAEIQHARNMYIGILKRQQEVLDNTAPMEKRLPNIIAKIKHTMELINSLNWVLDYPQDSIE